MGIKRWIVSKLDKEKASELSQRWNLPFFLAVILESRGITSNEEIESIIFHKNGISDPIKIKDMDKAISRVLTAINSFEKICIYGDYDADGVTSTALLYLYLKNKNANVTYYMPNRETDGYGLNINAINKIKEQNISLVICVDNGIASVEEIEYLNLLKIDCVVLDHHKPQKELPKAVAVVDPHRKDCESIFKYFAGVGVVFKFIQALETDYIDFKTLLDKYSDLVTIGTIGDIVPMKCENYFLVKEGLKRLSYTNKPGLKALLEQTGLYGRKLTATNVSFGVVPRINACGRMSSCDKVVKLLISEDSKECNEIAKQLELENQERKKIQADILKEVLDLLKREPKRKHERILIIEGQNWHEGVIGIVASKIVEKYAKPCIIISVNGDMAKGSGRSLGNFSLYEAVYSCSNYLTRFGGHVKAVGINLKSENITKFKNAMNKYASEYNGNIEDALNIDCKLRPESLSIDLIKQLDILEPFGSKNPEPVFAFFGVEIKEIHEVSGGKHLRLLFEKNNCVFSAMKFFTVINEFPYFKGDILDIAFIAGVTKYYGQEEMSIIIKDMKLSEIDLDAAIKEIKIYEKIKRDEKIGEEEITNYIPTRDDFVILYKYIKSSKKQILSLDILCFRLNNKNINLIKLHFMIDIMYELKLIDVYIDGSIYNITLKNVSSKVDINSSEILKSLIKKVEIANAG